MYKQFRPLWDNTKGNPQITIAILDGMADLRHPCLEEANLETLPTLVDTNTVSRHGTQVTSIVFANHTDRLKGIAPYCKGLLIPIFHVDSMTQQVNGTNQLDLARAIHLAIENGAHIINISGGVLDDSGEAEGLLQQALEFCEENNVLVVAAAGNDGCECIHIPAGVSTVLAVGATNKEGKPIEASNWGETYQNNGILALGKEVHVGLPDGKYECATGTSFATPIISGVAALLLSLQIEKGIKPNPKAIRQALLDTAIPCNPNTNESCEKYLVGQLNIKGAIKALFPQIQASTLNPKLLVTKKLRKITTNNKNSKIMNEVNNLSEEVESNVIPTSISSHSVIDDLSSLSSITPSCGEKKEGVSSCGCGGNKASTKAQLVYALGTLNFGYRNTAIMDSFTQRMPPESNIHDPSVLLGHLDQNPYAAQDIIWTLNQDGTPIYAIVGWGAYAREVYELLREFLKYQVEKGTERISIPGVLAGKTSLINGQTIPNIIPNIRGMYAWSTKDLVTALSSPKKAKSSQTIEVMSNFLERVYYELRNLGISAKDRAMNFAATNAFQVNTIYNDSIAKGLELENISVEKSPIARPGADAYDVKLSFFNPKSRFEQAKRIYRFTVDVSDVLPVTIGTIRSWSVY